MIPTLHAKIQSLIRSLQISDYENNVIFRDNDGTGSFAFTSTTAGTYKFCFSLQSTSMSLTILLNGLLTILSSGAEVPSSPQSGL